MKIKEIPVDDAIRVQALDRTYYFCSVKLGSLLWELNVFPEMPEQLPSVEEVHHKVELVVCLKREEQVDDEWVLDLFEYISLRFDA